jgi:hypothetical protein
LFSCFEYHQIDSDSYEKSKKQAQLINRIRWLAKMSSCAVLLINQASDIMDKKRSSLGRNIIPALGPSWDLNIDENI